MSKSSKNTTKETYLHDYIYDLFSLGSPGIAAFIFELLKLIPKNSLMGYVFLPTIRTQELVPLILGSALEEC